MNNKLTKYKKNKLSKTSKIIISFALIILTIGIGYSALVSNLSIIGNMVVKKYDDSNLFNKIANLSSTESCIYKYTGAVTDEVGNTVSEASNVYFNRCADKRNIKFAGYCWQMIRTTETGGIKMIYNGEPDNNGECGSSRANHKGIVQSYSNGDFVYSSYLYGSSFTYDTTNNEFTLIDTETATWSDSTYENLIGKFTCKTSSDTCTTLYQINAYASNIGAWLSYYTITDTNYAQIGTSAFNANQESPAMVGYMFNKVYNNNSKSPGTNTYKYGSTFTYSNGTYTLSGTTQDISDWSTGYNTINNTHYTCWNDTGTCTTISYIHDTSSSEAYYSDITDGKSVNDILTEMLSSNDVNRYNSSIKGIIDNWYNQNLSSKTNMLEDTVYCNARNIIDYGGWNPNGGSTTSNHGLKFKNCTSNNYTNNDISCPNETDQFALSNNKAKLTYPVALATFEELYILTNNNNNSYYDALTNAGAWYFSLSPSFFHSFSASTRVVNSNGFVDTDNGVNSNGGVRPTITLATDTIISSGTGTEADPFVIQES